MRILAASDEPDRGLEFERNRVALGALDGLLGAGDLEPDYLSFLADAFHAPLLYIRGNHDRGGNWMAGKNRLPMPIGERPQGLLGLRIAGLSWPGDSEGRAVRNDYAAWRQAISFYLRTYRRPPQIIVSHAPPLGVGDTPEDHYHRGFAGYRWLLQRLKPILWLHGHTSLAAAKDWRVKSRDSLIVNVTGGILIELEGAPWGGATIDSEVDEYPMETG